MKHIDYRISGDGKKYRIDRYDIVLGRNGENDTWKEDVYWETNAKQLKRHICFYGEYRFCIPLCNDTKHLKGTSDKYDKFIEL